MKETTTLEEYRELLCQLLIPKEICESVEDVDLEGLEERGFQTIFLDVDNTLITYNQRDLTLQRLHWVDRVKAKGFRVFLISNNKSQSRIARVAKQLDVEGLYFACKPFTFSIKEFARHHHIDLQKSVIIGDQLLTDVVLGNWIQAYSILVDPLDKRVSFIKTLQREVELYLLRKLEVMY